MTADHRRRFPAVIHGCVPEGDLVYVSCDRSVIQDPIPPDRRAMLECPVVPVPRPRVPGTPKESSAPVRIMETKAPGPRPTQIISAVPVWIVEPSPIYHDSVPNEGTKVAGCVPDINPIRRRVININVLDLIYRNCGRNRVDFRRHIITNAPGPAWTLGHKPDAVAHGVIFSACLDDVIR